MNEPLHPDGVSNVPWPTTDYKAREAADTSVWPGDEKAAPAVVELLNHAVQGAHETIDRLADSAAPAAQELGERVSAAGETIHAKTEQLRDIRDEWMESVRSTVRSNPLACIAAAVALGLVIARITR